MYRLLHSSLILLIVAASARGQAVTGTIFGNVSDSSGGRVAGAAVRAVNTDTTETHSTVTDTQGAYLFPALPAGRYRVETEASGFKKVVRDSVGLGVNQNARVDLVLEVGSITQEVHVREDAPLVDTREAQVAAPSIGNVSRIFPSTDAVSTGWCRFSQAYRKLPPSPPVTIRAILSPPMAAGHDRVTSCSTAASTTISSARREPGAQSRGRQPQIPLLITNRGATLRHG
jgi:hypothetical protein